MQTARRIREERNAALREAVETWGKSWYPRVAEANGRRFLHELDDVKDHLPDRTVDMSYLVYRELLLPMEDLIRITALRQVLHPFTPIDAMEFVLKHMRTTKSNAEFLGSMNR